MDEVGENQAYAFSKGNREPGIHPDGPAGDAPSLLCHADGVGSGGQCCVSNCPAAASYKLGHREGNKSAEAVSQLAPV